MLGHISVFPSLVLCVDVIYHPCSELAGGLSNCRCRDMFLGKTSYDLPSLHIPDRASPRNQAKHCATKTPNHYNDVIMGAMASQITSLAILYLTVYIFRPRSRKHLSSVSLAFVWGIHRWPVNSPHKWPVTRKMFPFGDVIMAILVFPQHTCTLPPGTKSSIIGIQNGISSAVALPTWYLVWPPSMCKHTNPYHLSDVRLPSF